MTQRCFIIQPFDKGKFDNRYTDIFAPAIEAAGMEPYRIDQDPAVRIPIEDIEKGISDSVLCFAEITTDNPNVWYELGYAIASNKDVILVCSDERTGEFPFDIRHRQITRYLTGSPSDYSKLGEAITKRINAIRLTDSKAKTLNQTPVVSRDGLKSQEIAMLVLVMQNEISGDNSMPVWTIKNEMQKAGYNDLGTSFALTTLSQKKMIEVVMDYDQYNNNQEFKGCQLTDLGKAWMLENEERFTFRIQSDNENSSQTAEPGSDDDLPF